MEPSSPPSSFGESNPRRVSFTVLPDVDQYEATLKRRNGILPVLALFVGALFTVLAILWISWGGTLTPCSDLYEWSREEAMRRFERNIANVPAERRAFFVPMVGGAMTVEVRRRLGPDPSAWKCARQRKLIEKELDSIYPPGSGGEVLPSGSNMGGSPNPLPPQRTSPSNRFRRGLSW